MGRVYGELRVNGHKLWTLFDTGARNSYVTQEASGDSHRLRVIRSWRVGLGGRKRRITHYCMMQGFLQRKPIEFDAYVTGDIGKDDDGRPIDLIVGALAMQKWCIRVSPDTESLDLSHYTSEFVEY